jgi:hypothetical protein
MAELSYALPDAGLLLALVKVTTSTINDTAGSLSAPLACCSHSSRRGRIGDDAFAALVSVMSER